MKDSEELRPDQEDLDPSQARLTDHSVTNSMVVVEKVYYRKGREQPLEFSSAFDRHLSTDEDPYVRRTTVSQSWVRLDLGWVQGSCGTVLLFNDEGREGSKTLSREKQAELVNRAVEVRYADAPEDQSWVVRAGESFRGEPSQADRLVVRCREGVSRIIIVAIPR